MDEPQAAYTHEGVLFRFKEEGNSTRATTQVNPEDTMLREISQSQKDIFYMLPLI